MPASEFRRNNGPDGSAAHEEAMACDAVEQREYSRPRAFFVGPATRLVRGGLFGKASDGYTGYYMEP
jgi:hypothetical protein